ncbi:hypothetical protein NE579_16035 [Intestinimonas massiliensis]|uniref:Uncharacterized protein n=1 Tax=Intestinimonas massiliensis (ex Afouda et al. 2020) TaxID=1673721 RepID=A0AAW5JVA5_9FIRM|nr:hypothetical protein [Intestinimonas massiliensis (ex Afouda et al. 2020)]MCQ4771929.1 hypothetical protein [Intestinimonas massiliensis (ex Afouda et al. 2020)]
MQRKYADSPLQFAYIGRWCGFFMSLRGVALNHLGDPLNGCSYMALFARFSTGLAFDTLFLFTE